MGKSEVIKFQGKCFTVRANTPTDKDNPTVLLCINYNQQNKDAARILRFYDGNDYQRNLEEAEDLAGLLNGWASK